MIFASDWRTSTKNNAIASSVFDGLSKANRAFAKIDWKNDQQGATDFINFSLFEWLYVR